MHLYWNLILHQYRQTLVLILFSHQKNTETFSVNILMLLEVLTNTSTGVTTNLAVVPNTNLPYNDTWNIRDLKNQPSAVIDIYDRYGNINTN
jgi:hypothetical protein